MELNEIVNGLESVKKLMASDLSIVTSYKLSKLAKKINEEFKDFEEKRIELIKKYGEEVKDKQGQYKIDSPEKVKLFNEELDKLLKLKVKFEFDKVKLSDIKDAKLSANDLLSLEPFLEADL